jgi:hypothetical protein
MRGRHASALAASIYLAIACSGGAFTAIPDESSGGGAGVATGGTKTSGGTTARAGSSTTAGVAAGGKSTGGMPTGGVAGTVVSAGTQGDGGVPVVSSCMAASECRASTLCREAICIDAECGERNVADGVYKLQVPGDCQELRCQGGQETIAAAPTDSDDLNECTTDACGAGGKPVHSARVGQVCANGGGICSPEGKCELCNRDLCPATECQLALCKDNTCHLSPRPIGTLCLQQTNQCDGAGTCVDCTDNGGCDEASVCSGNKCIPA